MSQFRSAIPRLMIARPMMAFSMIALLAACGGETVEAPAGPAPTEIAERQDNFEEIKDAFIEIRGQFEEGSPDLSIVESAAANINERAGAIPDYFPEGSHRDAGWDTEALPSIWEKPDEFAAGQQRLLDASANLMSAAASGDAAATAEMAGALGGACKNCHDQFRQQPD